jgi:hypothetical protein
MLMHEYLLAHHNVGTRGPRYDMPGVMTGLLRVLENGPHRCWVQIRPGMNSTHNTIACAVPAGTVAWTHGPLVHESSLGRS